MDKLPNELINEIVTQVLHAGGIQAICQARLVSRVLNHAAAPLLFREGTLHLCPDRGYLALAARLRYLQDTANGPTVQQIRHLNLEFPATRDPGDETLEALLVDPLYDRYCDDLAESAPSVFSLLTNLRSLHVRMDGSADLGRDALSMSRSTRRSIHILSEELVWALRNLWHSLVSLVLTARPLQADHVFGNMLPRFCSQVRELQLTETTPRNSALGAKFHEFVARCPRLTSLTLTAQSPVPVLMALHPHCAGLRSISMSGPLYLSPTSLLAVLVGASGTQGGALRELNLCRVYLVDMKMAGVYWSDVFAKLLAGCPNLYTIHIVETASGTGARAQVDNAQRAVDQASMQKLSDAIKKRGGFVLYEPGLDK